MIFFYHALALIMGYLLDLRFGDPKLLYHPVCITGNMVGWLRDHLPLVFVRGPEGRRRAGLFLVLIVCLYSLAVPAAILYVLYRIHPALGVAAETFWCFRLLATKSLDDAATEVYDSLGQKNMDVARHAVSMIVGRDTQSLDSKGIIKATVETVAENTSDGIIAPMFYMALGGVPLMYLYKGINTIDSMIGYKDEKYLDLGRYGARLDDVVNFLPARLSAVLMILAARVGGFDWDHAGKIFARDRFNHASPNSAQTESVMAGALNVQLAGDAWYFGKKYEKPTIGDDQRDIEREDILRSVVIMHTTAMFGAILMAACLLAGFLLHRFI